jgi:hypothetical protein
MCLFLDVNCFFLWGEGLLDVIRIYLFILFMNFMFLHLVDDRYDNLWHEVEVVLPSTKGALLAWSCHLQTW